MTLCTIGDLDRLLAEIKEWLDEPVRRNTHKGRRDFTCVREIWVECFGYPIEEYHDREARLLNMIMQYGVLGEEWEKVGPRRFALYGGQRAFRRRRSASRLFAS